MSTMEICPEESVIAAWLGGEIDEDIAESIGDHVDGCETCFGRTTRLEANPDGIAQFLQDAVAEAPPEVTGDLLPSRYPQTLQNIGEYKVIERLGSGGMGAVFVAMHGRLRRSVALKVLSERSANDQRAIARFNREMEVVGRLNHPNIVQALDAGEADGTNYLAMELLNGADLSRVLTSSKTLSVPDATEIARQAALGLNYAHDRGMIHRDVKPSNLMLARENDGRTRVKILDLGLAIIQESAPDAELTDAGQLMGTLEYMAPEQTEDTHSVDHTADIYALGSTLYRMLVGHVPFSGEVWNTPAKRLKGLLNHDAPGIRETRPDLPDELITLIDSMLKRDVTDRPRSMREVAEALLPFSITHKISELPGIASSTASVATTHGIHSAFDDTQRTVRTTVEPVAAKWAKPGLIVAVCLIAILSFPALSAIRSWMATAPSVSDADRTDEVRTTTPDAPKDTSVRVKASQGLIGLWSFENSDDGLNRDLSGHARHGTMTGSPAKSAGAPIPDNKTSQEFGHKGGETTISHHETLSCPDTMSIAFWLRRGHAYNRAEIPIIEKQGSFTVAIVGA
ncbi:MAG: serine/threonine protein kinase, partial [Planctomycetaceae bacterium]